jgi:hypothetical protein
MCASRVQYAYVSPPSFRLLPVGESCHCCTTTKPPLRRLSSPTADDARQAQTAEWYVFSCTGAERVRRMGAAAHGRARRRGSHLTLVFNARDALREEARVGALRIGRLGLLQHLPARVHLCAKFIRLTAPSHASRSNTHAMTVARLRQRCDSRRPTRPQPQAPQAPPRAVGGHSGIGHGMGRRTRLAL